MKPHVVAFVKKMYFAGTVDQGGLLAFWDFLVTRGAKVCGCGGQVKHILYFKTCKHMSGNMIDMTTVCMGCRIEVGLMCLFQKWTTDLG